ncbi:hypothetical protein ACP275_08G238900 [Erythranthe tilingii]
MDCEKIFSCKLNSYEFRTETKPDDDMIAFTFNLITSTISDHPRSSILPDSRSVTLYIVDVDREKIFRFEETRNSMEEQLWDLLVDSGTRRKLVEYAWREAVKALHSADEIDEDKAMKIDFDLSLEHRPRNISNEFSPCLAVDSSVQELKTVAGEYSGDWSLKTRLPYWNMSCPRCFGDWRL